MSSKPKGNVAKVCCYGSRLRIAFLVCAGLTSVLAGPAAGGGFNTPGNILITDQFNNRAIEVTHTMPSTIVATFTAGGTVSGVAFASRLEPSGNTLITDSNNSRIVEVNSLDVPVWEYFTNTRPGSNPAPLPTRAVRLMSGNTLISDQFNDQVIEVDPSKTIVASYGVINNPGFNPHTVGKLNGPYSAYVIGDYTGITPPFGF